MNKFCLFHFKITLPLSLLFVMGCSSAGKFWDQWSGGNENKDFDKLVQIEEVEVIKKAPPIKTAKNIEKKPPVSSTGNKNNSLLKPKIKNPHIGSQKSQISKPEKPLLKAAKQNIELPPETIKPKAIVYDDIIAKSPFRVGQKTKIAVSYLNMTAGYLTMETKKIVKVNGRLSYHFGANVQSRRAFSFIYSVEDKANTYVDIETLRPYTLDFLAKETKKIKESKTFFDWPKKRATYWSRKVKKGRKPKESKKTWKIVEGSQNFVSALFYLRTIDFSKSKNFSFPLADEGKNILLKGKVIRQETLSTDVGKIKAWLVEPQFHIKGSLTPVGRVRIWFKADKFREIVKLETKLKFGSIVGEIVR